MRWSARSLSRYDDRVRGRQSAVHCNVLTAHIRRRIGCQKQSGAREFFRCAGAVQRMCAALRKMTEQYGNVAVYPFPRQISSFVITPDDRPDVVCGAHPREIVTLLTVFRRE